jgi:phenylpropionate dioxygenase-like ring-hydroxylating dioxygenase large terminal subunit
MWRASSVKSSANTEILQVNTEVLESLIARRQPGYTLPASFYMSPAVFDADVARIFGRYWIFVGVDPEIPQAGTAVWKATNEQDCSLVARAHLGISSPAYLPGPYSAYTEDLIDTFCTWYLNHLQAP